MINLLIWFEASHFINVEIRIDPLNVPIGLVVCKCQRFSFFIGFPSCASPTENLFGNVLDQVISNLAAIQYDFIL